MLTLRRRLHPPFPVHTVVLLSGLYLFDHGAGEWPPEGVSRVVLALPDPISVCGSVRMLYHDPVEGLPASDNRLQPVGVL
jgi:hypothetical protein